MIYDHSSDLFSIRLHNDDNQDFDLRWEQAISSTSDPKQTKIWKVCTSHNYRIRLNFRLFWHFNSREAIRSGGEPDYHRLRTCVKLHIDQTLRNKNFKVQNEMVERGAVTKGFRGNKSFVERRVGESFQVESKWILFKREVL